MKRVSLIFLMLLPVAFAQENSSHSTQAPSNVEAIRPSTPCEGLTGGMPDAVRECQKRETARLFIILGKPEAALRILCTTNVARDAFGVAHLDCLQETKAEKPPKTN